MRIVHIAGICHTGPSGGSRVVADLAIGLQTIKACKNIVIGTFSKMPALASILEQAGVKLIDQYVPAFSNCPINLLLSLKHILSNRHLANIDIIHAHANYLGPAAIAGYKQAKFVISLHGAPGFQCKTGIQHIPAVFIRRQVLNRANAIIANSSFMRNAFAKHPAAKNCNVDVIYNGCDTDFFCPGPPISENPTLTDLKSKGKIILGVVGRLSPGKKPLTAIRILSEIIRSSPDFTLVFVGNGEMEPEIVQYIEKMNMQHHVKLLGFQEDILNIYRQLDILVHMAHDEPFGCVFTEAMACELPVIGAAGGAIHEIVKHGKTGYICSLENMQEWQSALLKLRKVELRQQMGKSGRELVCRKFSLQSMISAYYSTYQSITQSTNF